MGGSRKIRRCVDKLGARLPINDGVAWARDWPHALVVVGPLRS